MRGFSKNEWLEEAIIDEAKELNPLFGWNIQDVEIRGHSRWYIDNTCWYNDGRMGDLVVIYEKLDNKKIKELAGILEQQYPGIISTSGSVELNKLGLFLDHTKAIEIINKRLLGYIERDQAAKENPEKNVGILEKSGWENIGFWCCRGDEGSNSSEASALTRDNASVSSYEPRHPLSYRQ